MEALAERGDSTGGVIVATAVMSILLLPYLAAAIFIAMELRGALTRRAFATPALPAWCWIALLILTYGVQLGVTRYGATHLIDGAAWRLTMPLPVMYVDARHVEALATLYLACAAAQSYALLALYRGRPGSTAVWIGAGALAAMSLASPSLVSFDAYGYVHNAILGLQSYVPPSTPFPGEYRVIDLWFRKPTATLYGPLWLVYVRVVTFALPTLLGKIVAMRVANLLLYAALVAMLRYLGLPRRIVVAAALNPGMLFQFVANVHNDIIPIDLLLAAAALLRTNRWAGFGLYAAAGLVKLPYLALGLPVFAALRGRWTRVAYASAAILVALALSWFGGGAPYAQALARYASLPHAQTQWRIVPVLLALAALVAAFAGARRFIGALWLIPTIGAFELPWAIGPATFAIPWVFPWYLIWGLPYALARRRIAGFLLVAFPFVSAILTPELLQVRVVLALAAIALVTLLGRWFVRPRVEASTS